MPEIAFEVDVDSPPSEQPDAKPFNRWHPDIPAVAEADPGETMRLEALIGPADRSKTIITRTMSET